LTISLRMLPPEKILNILKRGSASALTGRFIQLEEHLEGKFSQLDQRMTIKLYTLMVTAVSAVAALVKVL
jgi:hypothetical protein